MMLDVDLVEIRRGRRQPINLIGVHDTGGAATKRDQGAGAPSFSSKPDQGAGAPSFSSPVVLLKCNNSRICVVLFEVTAQHACWSADTASLWHQQLAGGDDETCAKTISETVIRV